ncbi:hypothetical protein EJ07DRAFT_115346 [Lizonia empirigonia]|nr:hypothetical protein EJ07DRAFT_115346 [Lizonia empirigonia]
MVNEARHYELKERMTALKSLYASRYYSQCAKFGELLLSEIHDQTHPLHLAHLNFYTALSHDTLAREATLKNRWKGLSLAELHYNAALLALSSFQSTTQCDPWSPSSTSDLPSPYSRRRSSIDSDVSTASSVTSLGDDDDEYMQKSAGKSTSQRVNKTATRPQFRPTASPPTARPQTPQQFYFNANIASFARMIQGHLADVFEQKRKTSVLTVRFTMPSPRLSPTRATGHSRALSAPAATTDESAMEARRQRRRAVTFRPRFDATSVQRLCNEALAELSC